MTMARIAPTEDERKTARIDHHMCACSHADSGCGIGRRVRRKFLARVFRLAPENMAPIFIGMRIAKAPQSGVGGRGRSRRL
ncbi:hypothetical protein [Sphingomonas natans]|uniref:hypothetical protein n=1 Tax=Sphingomonas natans TaxID=3063330 RepID=UPI0026E29520|nr:hypothetical protein [Sphingomonas sp. BIUV-7]